MLHCVLQDETSGCAIAAVANVAGTSYAAMQAIAESLGIRASDCALWSRTDYVRRLLAHLGLETSDDEPPFTSWHALPDCALLAIKHHQEAGVNFWHWVVFKRVNGQHFVLDSARYLSENVRQDFAAMQPKWFMPITRPVPTHQTQQTLPTQPAIALSA